MALNSNALVTVAELLSYMRATVHHSEVMLLWHDETILATTTATVEVNSSGVLVLRITGPVVPDEFLTLSSFTDVNAVATTINALGTGWKATVIGSGTGALSASVVVPFPATNARTVNASQYLSAIDYSAFEQAINFSSQTIETYCGRTFASTTYTHMYRGKGVNRMQLRQRPIIRVDRMAIGKRDALLIRNTSTDAIQANIQITLTEMRLDVVGGTNASASTVAYTGATTLSTLITSINALGKGWVAELTAGSQGAWLVTDLLLCAPRNALNNQASFFVPEESVESFDIESPTGTLYLREQGRSSMVYSYVGPRRPVELLPLTSNFAGPVFPEGIFNIYVMYVAGYATIPADVKWACAEIASNAYHASQRDTSLRSESVEGYDYDVASIFGAGQAKSISDQAKSRLAPYRILLAPEYIEA